MKKVRNVPQSIIDRMSLSDKIESLSDLDTAIPTSEFAENARVAQRLRPATHYPATEPITSLRQDDELIYAAIHPGDLIRLGYEYFEFTNDVQIMAPSTTEIKVLEVKVPLNSVFVFLDWRNYALKNVGGQLYPMYPGELDNSNFEVFLSSGTGKSSPIGRYIYGTDQRVQNAIGTIETQSFFIWPGKFRHIIRGERTISVYIRYLVAALPPYTIPAVFASKIMGYYKET